MFGVEQINKFGNDLFIVKVQAEDCAASGHSFSCNLGQIEREILALLGSAAVTRTERLVGKLEGSLAKGKNPTKNEAETWRFTRAGA
jgi:hypothetical protein